MFYALLRIGLAPNRRLGVSHARLMELCKQATPFNILQVICYTFEYTYIYVKNSIKYLIIVITLYKKIIKPVEAVVFLR